jgi:hypothetical protein
MLYTFSSIIYVLTLYLLYLLPSLFGAVFIMPTSGNGYFYNWQLEDQNTVCLYEIRRLSLLIKATP